MKLMKLAELASTGAPETSVFHQLSAGNNGSGPGTVPLATGTLAGHWPSGCRFRSRCPLADGACEQTPPLKAVGDNHFSACWHADRVAGIA